MTTQKALILNLNSGSYALATSIRKAFPTLSDEEVAVIINAMIKEVGERIAAGEQLAFVKNNPDGTAELTVWGLEPIKN